MKFKAILTAILLSVGILAQSQISTAEDGTAKVICVENGALVLRDGQSVDTMTLGQIGHVVDFHFESDSVVSIVLLDTGGYQYTKRHKGLKSRYWATQMCKRILWDDYYAPVKLSRVKKKLHLIGLDSVHVTIGDTSFVWVHSDPQITLRLAVD